MPEFPLIQVDAFTRQPLGGNPCAEILVAGRLSPADMLAIAREEGQFYLSC